MDTLGLVVLMYIVSNTRMAFGIPWLTLEHQPTAALMMHFIAYLMTVRRVIFLPIALVRCICHQKMRPAVLISTDTNILRKKIESLLFGLLKPIRVKTLSRLQV